MPPEHRHRSCPSPAKGRLGTRFAELLSFSGTPQRHQTLKSLHALEKSLLPFSFNSVIFVKDPTGQRMISAGNLAYVENSKKSMLQLSGFCWNLLTLNPVLLKAT